MRSRTRSPSRLPVARQLDFAGLDKLPPVPGIPADPTQHPVKRIGTPDDIASLALYLCSDDASFITGENIVVDGASKADDISQRQRLAVRGERHQKTIDSLGIRAGESSHPVDCFSVCYLNKYASCCLYDTLPGRTAALFIGRFADDYIHKSNYL